MSEPNPIKVDMTVAEGNQLVNMAVSESGEMFPMQHSEVVISTSTDYEDLFHKPQINGVELVGDLDSSDLGLQSALEFDDSPTQDSANPVTSGGVYEALQDYATEISEDYVPSSPLVLGGESTIVNNGTITADVKRNIGTLQSPNRRESKVTIAPDKVVIDSGNYDAPNARIQANATGWIDLMGNMRFVNINGDLTPSILDGVAVPTTEYRAANKKYVDDSLAGKQDTITDLATIRTGAALGATAVQQEVDPTVPAWAKAPTKPSYTASEVGALPDSTVIPSKTSDLTNDSGFITQASIPVQSVNGQTGAVVLDADDVGALPDTTTIPTKTSDLQNDSGYITGITSANVTTALGYTPYNATNPSGYVNSTQAANAAPVQSVNGQTGAVSLTIPTVPTNVSAFTNDSGYLTLSTLPIYSGGVS